MRLNDPDAYIVAHEADLIADRLDLAGRQVLELGCGNAYMTRVLAERFHPAGILATEVDRVQLERNLAGDFPPQVRFAYGGAEAVEAPDGHFDAVFLFKSFHHVPEALMARSLDEIHRVLRPGGWAWFSEPVYWGAFNDVLRLFHDERVVREAAFRHIQAAVASGRFALEEEIFFQYEGIYPDWADFERRFLKVTHTRHDLDEALYERVKAAFEVHLGPEGARFMKPHRVDLLRKV